MAVLEFHVVGESGLKRRTSMHLDVTLEMEPLALTTVCSKRERLGRRGSLCLALEPRMTVLRSSPCRV